MKRHVAATIAVVMLVLGAAAAFAQPQVSEKKEIAIFSLGFYGWDIPRETLGTIDIDIQRVFLDLGRFTIIGMEQRFSAGAVDDFIAVLRKIKEENFVLPEKYQFGEAFLTEADFNKLVGAFIIAVPVVTSYDSQFVDGKTWETHIKTNVSFIDVGAGTLLGIANVETSGSSKETQYKSIQSAIDGIPGQLDYEIRSIPAFQISTRILAANGSNVDIQLGADMGLKVGDEYSVIVAEMLEGIVDEREAGLIIIREVGSARSKGTVLYSDIQLGKDVQLKEIPRMGVDFGLYAHSYSFIVGPVDPRTGIAVGFRTEMTRGFYSIRPYAAFQAVLDSDWLIPISLIVGGEYTVYAGRLEFGGRAGVSGSTPLLFLIAQEEYGVTDDTWLTHYGVSVGGYASYLFSRDMKFFVDVQVDFNLGVLDGWGSGFDTYGGAQIGVGVTFKQ